MHYLKSTSSSRTSDSERTSDMPSFYITQSGLPAVLQGKHNIHRSTSYSHCHADTTQYRTIQSDVAIEGSTCHPVGSWVLGTVVM